MNFNFSESPHRASSPPSLFLQLRNLYNLLIVHFLEHVAALLELFPLMDPLHRLLPFDVGGNPPVIKVAFDEGLSVSSN